jgi:hypothetical protein
LKLCCFKTCCRCCKCIPRTDRPYTRCESCLPLVVWMLFSALL